MGQTRGQSKARVGSRANGKKNQIKEEGRKYFVLDTNILLHDPGSIKNYHGHTIIIPMTVVEELNDFKKGLDTKNKNAREVIRFLDNLRSENPGLLGSENGVRRECGGCIRTVVNEKKLMAGMDLKTGIPDNMIIGVAYGLKKQGKDVVFVSKDINARLKADSFGIAVDEYDKKEFIEPVDSYLGCRSILVPGKMIEEFYKHGSVNIPGNDFFPNEFAILTNEDNNKHTAIAKAFSNGYFVKLLFTEKEHIYGISPKNKEQRMGLDLILDPKVSLVTLSGQAGTGKTLLAVAASLKLIVSSQAYKRVLFARPVIPMGNDLGYLPGNKEEKLDPWMEGLKDNLSVICNRMGNGKKDDAIVSPESLISNGIFVPTALTYVRGRSIPDQMVIVDEAQNLTPREAKTIISRIGEGSKIVLMGDPEQIDNPFLDERSNGLAYVIDRMRDLPMYGHITLTETVRSALAQAAAERL
ncbi:MAG: PhoH family protein [Bacteroidales bacterium]|jgi:PhoH-like ATPase|nr:PhoH family protein [Bacteroidales bacterium]